MKLKKLLGIITIVIVVVFSMMLTTSYAWYAFDNASTTFEGMTNNDDIIVSYREGEYINTTNAIPITNNQVDKYSEKNNFSIKVKNNVKNTEILVSISLVDIVIDGPLQTTNFKIELYHQDTKVSDIAGNTIGTGGTTKKLADVILDNNVTNNFELRIYILDNGADQSSLQNKNFQAKIKVDVISRLKNSLNDYSNPDIYISSVTIDGEACNYIPIEGYYDMTATCSKGSNLTWEPLSKTITYNSGSYVNDNCSLTFTSSTDYPPLSEMPVGSYVKYTGTNGCDGIHCEGYNANYVSDTNMGYCYSSDYKFLTNGWRIAYVENGSAHLISAGAPECINTYVDNKSSSLTSATWSTSYYYGSGYVFNDSTGKYILNGLTSSALSWSSNYEKIINDYKYTCKSTSVSSNTCDSMYEIASSSTSSSVKYYTFYNHEVTSGVVNHLSNLNKKSLKYCNKKYAKNNVCNDDSSWAMNAYDFEKITNNTLTSSSCYNDVNNFSCGYANDLIDNGGYYWIASTYTATSNNMFFWSPVNRATRYNTSKYLNGIRPILALDSSIIVVNGNGTYSNPYIIYESQN